VAKHDKGAKRAPGQESPSLSAVCSTRAFREIRRAVERRDEGDDDDDDDCVLPLGLVARQPTDQRVKQRKRRDAPTSRQTPDAGPSTLLPLPSPFPRPAPHRRLDLTQQTPQARGRKGTGGLATSCDSSFLASVASRGLWRRAHVRAWCCAHALRRGTALIRAMYREACMGPPGCPHLLNTRPGSSHSSHSSPQSPLSPLAPHNYDILYKLQCNVTCLGGSINATRS
jgi:hypothetical protein